MQKEDNFLCNSTQPQVIYKVNQQGGQLTKKTLRKTLDVMQVSQIQNVTNEFNVRSKQDTIQTTIQKALGITTLLPLFPKSREIKLTKYSN